MGAAHRGLEVDGLNVLPVLLQQGDQEVDAQGDVQPDVIGVHLDMASADRQAKGLLELELHCAADVRDLKSRQRKRLVGA